MRILAAAASSGFGFGLLVSGYTFGLRHGIDWDHIAAITDITGSQEERRDSLLYGTLYAVGHAVVVLVLGIVAIVAGDRLPDEADAAMERVVGVTLLLLGVYVLVSLVRHGRDFRMRSRWMLVFAGFRKASRWARRRLGARNGAVAVVEGDDPVLATTGHHGHHGRLGHHHHDRPVRDDDDIFPSYGRRTSFGVGMIHGVGAETPTQVLIFLAAGGAGGPVAGVLVLVAFILGLLTSNTFITVGSSLGFLSASRNFAVYATIAVLTGVFSLFLGVLFVAGRGAILPAFFGT